LAEIQRLKPYHIYVLGGTGVVSNAVLSQLASYDNPGSTGPYRLAGADRYATAAAISKAAFDPGLDVVFVANGTDFPDALAGGPAAATREAPVLLTKPTSIPQATKDELARLHPARIVILGGIGAVSQAVANELQAYAQLGVQRWAGADRYATAVAISEEAFPAAATVFVAAGYTFPDALSGGPAAGAYAGPLLLTRQSSAPDVTKQELSALQPVRIFVLGGTGAISNTVIAEIQALFP
jgi:putative cell wall-binding protein